MKLFDVIPAKEDMNKFTYELLKEWHKTLAKYETEWSVMWKVPFQEGNYLPYVYNEEAQIGLLAVAAAGIGGFPFLEFDQDKRTPTGRGYQDLEIIWEKQIWSIEAKYLKMDVQDENIEEILRHYIKLARDDVKRLKYRKIGKSMALVFFRPYNYPTNSTHISFINQVKNVNMKRIKCDFLAYHLCQQNILAISYHTDSPGIAILGQYVS